MNSLQITDHVEGRCSTAVARYHVHPDIEVESNGEEGRLILLGGRQVAWRVNGGKARVVPSQFHPEFGLSIPNTCIEAAAIGPSVTMTFAWS